MNLSITADTTTPILTIDPPAAAKMPLAKIGLDDWLVKFDECDRGSRLHDLLKTAHEPMMPAGETIKRHAKTMDAATLAQTIIDGDTLDDTLRLRYWRGSWWRWTRGAYRELDDADIQSTVVRAINRDYSQVGTQHIGNVSAQLQALSLLSSRIDAPSWLDSNNDWRPDDLLVAKNGIINLRRLVDGADDYFREPTPRYFSTAALDYDFSDSPAKPERWLNFLHELWGDDQSSVELLQEFFGYALTLDTRQQKFLLIHGPKRSGKGTIARVLRRLIGEANCASPTLASLAERFGLAPLIGKPLAIITDARLSRRSDQSTIVERILSISGEDSIDIDRKFRTTVTCKLPTRFLIISNELPRLDDASGALTGRTLLLRLTRSFFDHEDIELTDRLVVELPGILLWAINGWARLKNRGRFEQPASSLELLGQLSDLASPISQFIRERCVTGPQQSCSIDAIYDAYRQWCLDAGRSPPSKGVFGRDLHAADANIRNSQPWVDGERQRVYIGIDLAS